MEIIFKYNLEVKNMDDLVTWQKSRNGENVFELIKNSSNKITFNLLIFDVKLNNFKKTISDIREYLFS